MTLRDIHATSLQYINLKTNNINNGEVILKAFPSNKGISHTFFLRQTCGLKINEK